MRHSDPHPLPERRLHRILVIASLLALAAWPMPAQLRLPSVIGDGMVLQRDATVPIWGWAKPGEVVRVVASWDQNAQTSAAGADGSWTIRMRTPAPGGPHTLTISDGDAITLKDVLIGEVWLCSGQSNMEMPVGVQGSHYRGVANWEQELAHTNHPRLRLFNVTNAASMVPMRDCKGSWAPSTAESVHGFSGTAYFFGRAVQQALNIPVGLIESDWGGTPAEAWTSEEGLSTMPDFADAVAALARARAHGGETRPQEDVDRRKPAVLYNGMIAPLVPYAIRGAIWYQGESNRSRALQYRTLFPAMIADWRRRFGVGDFPFYFVQIAPFEYSDPPGRSAALREAQLKALSVPNTGMVVTMDVGNAKDIHPNNKQEVGRRLALWALTKTYGRTDFACSGPLYRSMKVEGGRIRISFDHVGGGLGSGGKPLTHFEIAGADRSFAPATAEIDGATVVVSSPQVTNPVAARFACGNADEPNLANLEGLPASPFRTDDWPLDQGPPVASKPGK